VPSRARCHAVAARWWPRLSGPSGGKLFAEPSGGRLRPLIASSLLLASACAHVVAEPTYAGRVRDLHFDRASVTGPSLMLSRSSDGSWVGHACAGAPGNCPTEFVVGPDAIRIPKRTRAYPLLVEADAVTVQDTYADFVFRRVDGSPMPLEAAVPIWLAIQLSSRWTAPDATCLAVEGLGAVQVLVVPTGWEVQPGRGCTREAPDLRSAAR